MNQPRGTPPTAADVRSALDRIAPDIRVTPLLPSAWLARETGVRTSLKLESLQITGAFKIRGALNALRQLPAGTHVVTASAGNHGHAVAYAAAMLGLRATIYVPAGIADAKRRGIEAHPAAIDAGSRDYDEAERRARDAAAGAGAAFISPYNHPDVIAGAGTIALEVFDEAPDVDLLVVPLGGGGLASGIALATGRRARIVGVEVEASTAFTTALCAGGIVPIVAGPTLADGLSGNLEADAMTFDIVRRLVDDVIAVSEEEVRAAMRGLAGREHLVTEGSGAVAVAAMLAGKVGKARHAVAIVSGGNIDLVRFAEVIGWAG